MDDGRSLECCSDESSASAAVVTCGVLGVVAAVAAACAVGVCIEGVG